MTLQPSQVKVSGYLLITIPDIIRISFRLLMQKSGIRRQIARATLITIKMFMYAIASGQGRQALAERTYEKITSDGIGGDFFDAYF